MIRIVLIGSYILLLIVIFNGCSNENTKNILNKYGIQPPIDKLYWGMTIPDIEEVLSIKDGQDGVVYSKEDAETVITITD